MVGQYQGPTGTAALAVVAPVWNIIYSLGLLTGIGGSVLLSTMRGQAAGSEKRSNEYFSAAVIGTVILAALAWAGLLFFDRPLLTLFGAEETLLPLARAYLFPIKFVVPSFLFTQLMSAFLRNDGDPALATKAVLFGGIFNVFGDYFFVFTLDMGIMGAGIATAMGSVFSLIIMLTHFFRNALLRDVRRQKLGHGNAQLPQRLIVPQLGAQLVAEGVVGAGLVVDLFQNILRRSVRHKIGIAAFSLPQEPDHAVFRVVYRHCVRHCPVSAASGFPERRGCFRRSAPGWDSGGAYRG